MADAAVLALALSCSAAGMGWLALAMRPNWEQVRGPLPRPPHAARRLRALAALALFGSLLLLLSIDHASMAVLVWVMSLGASALSVAFTLAWRPRWLGWLAGHCVRPRSGGDDTLRKER